ncbi:MAG: FadR/GntR family transcriptional regulator [Reyranellaceae bacterium]
MPRNPLADVERAERGGARRVPLSLKVYRDLLERIGKGEFAVGAKLPTEKELGETYGVSRAVVREAISSLKADGIVRAAQGVGAFVLNTQPVPYSLTRPNLTTLKEAIDLLELRTCVECEAAALAATRHNAQMVAEAARAIEGMERAVEEGRSATDWDMRFHRAISAMTENPQFRLLFELFGEQLLPRARFSPQAADRDSMRAYLAGVNEEHRAILAAIQRGDPETARAAMRLHLSNVQGRLRKAYAERRKGGGKAADAAKAD